MTQVERLFSHISPVFFLIAFVFFLAPKTLRAGASETASEPGSFDLSLLVEKLGRSIELAEGGDAFVADPEVLNHLQANEFEILVAPWLKTERPTRSELIKALAGVSSVNSRWRPQYSKAAVGSEESLAVLRNFLSNCRELHADEQGGSCSLPIKLELLVDWLSAQLAEDGLFEPRLWVYRSTVAEASLSVIVLQPKLSQELVFLKFGYSG